MTTKYMLRKPAATGPAPDRTRLQPIGTARHSRDSECPDAGWKRLSNKQKARLSILARKAYRLQRVQGIDPEEWRHEVAISVCGCRISEAVQDHWTDLYSAFVDLAGEPEKAFEAQLRSGDNKRRVALYKLTGACKERGLDISYAEAICMDTFKSQLAKATAKQIWCVFFTVTNRRKAVKK